MATVGLGLTLAAARSPSRGGVLLAVSAGLVWGASEISIKALSDSLDDGLGVLLHPLAFVILTASLVGLSISACSLQVGPAEGRRRRDGRRPARAPARLTGAIG